ncbi:hypothetical protein CB1_001814009 [Camelus ferus]|nr:hypothetical protein CB1_001814009 [Camelus ferus]
MLLLPDRADFLTAPGTGFVGRPDGLRKLVKGTSLFSSLPLLDLGALSAARESWEYDSGARDLQSPDLQGQSALQKLLDCGGSSLHQHAAALHKLLTQSPHSGNSVGGSYLELANTDKNNALAVLRIAFSVCAISDFAPLQPRFGAQRKESMNTKELVNNIDFSKGRDGKCSPNPL